MKNKAIKPNLSGYTETPKSEDVYQKWEEETEMDPNDLSKKKPPNEKPHPSDDKDFLEDLSGDDLDVPGSELDDQQEEIGSEDEENNYYSLGGDNHPYLDKSNA